jgi:preprotein translocase subunit SecB
MTPRKSKHVGVASYTDFLSSLEPIWISLVGTNFTGDRERYFEFREHQLSVSWDVEQAECRKDFFEVRVKAAVRVSPPKSDKSFFDLTATYHLHVHASSPLNKDHVKRFAEGELRLLLWPYLREYVSSVSGRMHVPSVLLPVTGYGKR